MGAIKGCFLVPLSGCEGNTFFYASCQRAGRSMCPIGCCDPLNLVSYYHFLCASTYHSSSPAILYVRAVNKYVLSVYRVLAEFMFRLARCQAVARTADRTASLHSTFGDHVTSSVTWPFVTAHMLFPIGGPLEPSLYLQRFPRYSTSNVTQWLTWPWYDL